MRNKHRKGSTIITTPVVIAIGIMMVSCLITMAVKILMPYIWYEKLSSTCIKYVFVMEEYGYLTKIEANHLSEELMKQGFKKEQLVLDYTNRRVSYGEPIYLKVSYQYRMQLPFSKEQMIPMVIQRNSVSKR